MSDAYRVRLLDAVTDATTAHVRAHDGTHLVASSNAPRIA